ncbi:MAG TPA: SusC/RagA family TonB-linked outer membrane protein [Longimicrobiales bacterium]
MKKRIVTVLMGLCLFAAQAYAQQKTVTGRVTNEQGDPMAGVQIAVKGTAAGTLTNQDGAFSLRVNVGQVLQFSYIGTATVERVVGSADVINVQMRMAAISLEGVEVTAMGQTATRKSLGSSQQTVAGTAIAQAQKENWANALQGRVAGLEVVSNSGVPGASAQILLRGVSSVSGNNQPLIVIDGLPVDNKVQHSNQLFPSLFENRGIDFTNRGADFNPEDIETVTVLKGPEAAALYGIDAANGAIVITTKRGKPGSGGFEYSNSVKIEYPGRTPVVQREFGPDRLGTAAQGTWLYWGDPYPANANRYDNISGFFQDAITQRHNLSFSGASADSRITYRLSGGLQEQRGVIPNSEWDKINISAATEAMATNWLRADVVLQYSTDFNNQPFKGAGGPLLGLLAWPDTLDASNWLTEDGRRRRITTLAASAEVDNPYFSVNRNDTESRTNRINVNVGLTLLPVSWGNLRTQIGVDSYNQRIQVLRDPESSMGVGSNGILDQSTDVTRNITVQSLLNLNRYALTNDIGVSGMLGGSALDQKSDVAGATGSDFLEPTFVSMNNTRNRSAVNWIRQRRLVSAFGSAQFDYKDYLFLTMTGRNDWTSTIPQERNSFFYPSVQGSFVFTDAIPSIGQHMSGRVRAAWAQVGKDARPYAYAPSLEAKPTSYLGYGYGFTGPNPNLKPEFAVSKEAGVELGFFENRLGFDATIYRKDTRDQIVDNVRASYGSGYILINLNGATTRSEGVELTVRGIPIQRPGFSWDFQANFTKNNSTVLSLPEDLPEYYSSDTWLVGNVRNGVRAGTSTMGLYGLWYLRNRHGDVLIEPATGLPLRDANFSPGPYDRNPDFLIGLSNTVTWKRFTLSALLDIRKGGDVFNATEWWLTQRGLSERTLDRWEPRVVTGVLRDGLENTDNPTRNSIVVVPALNNNYYLTMSEEVFIEKDINWLRLRDVTVSYALPAGIAGLRTASVFLTGTELLLVTNYSGMDPIVNGNTAATGGSGGIGIDYGNFPMPVGINFGVRVGF